MSAPPRKRITAVGSLNVDLVVRAPRAPEAGETVTGFDLVRHAGGKGANQAAAAARLSLPRDPDEPDGPAAVALIGRVGADAEGTFLVETLAALGIDASGVGRDPDHGTGIAVITVATGTGENRIVLVPGANAALSPGVLGRHHDVLAASDVLLIQLEIPLPTVQTAARMGREKHAVVILDPAPARALPGGLLRLCDFVMPNESELAVLLDRSPAAGPAPLPEIAAAGRQLLLQGARNVVVKLGARGALLLAPGVEQHVPAFAVTAVDTTGAGDAFAGAFAVALAEGRPVTEALRFANATAALSVTRPGTIASLPTRAEVDTLLGS